MSWIVYDIHLYGINKGTATGVMSMFIVYGTYMYGINKTVV